MELSRSRGICHDRMIDNDGRMLKQVPNQYNSGNMFHFIPNENHDNNPAFVVLPKHDYESIKSELMSVKQSLNECKSFVNYELQQLKQDTTELLKQVERCRCEQQQAELMMRKIHYNNSHMNTLPTNNTTNNNSINSQWNSDGAWDNTKPLFNADQPDSLTASLHSTPITSTPDRCKINELNDLANISNNSFLNAPKLEIGNPMNDNKQIQLLPNYEVYVNRLNLQIVVNEGLSHKENGGLYVLRRLIPLVFAWEELAESRGQGLNCKSTEDVSSKLPLHPTKVLACKAYMRKFCLESGCLEPTERAINQTFSHQVNYARRRVKDSKEPRKVLNKRPLKRGRKPKLKPIDIDVDTKTHLESIQFDPSYAEG